MAPERSERKRLFLPIPPDWDKMTDAEKDAASLAMAEEMQRRLGISDKSVQRDQTPATRKSGDDQP